MSPGLKATGDLLGLDNLVAEEPFNNAILDTALWGTYISGGSGSASIGESGDRVNIKTTTADGAAMLYYKETLHPRASRRWRLKWKLRQDSGDMVACALLQETGIPQAGGIYSKALAEIAIDSNGAVTVAYFDTSGQKIYWGSPGWGSGYYAVPVGGGLDNEIVSELENDGDGLTFRIFNADESETYITATVPWSSVRAEAGNLYFYGGDPFTTQFYGDLDIHDFQHYGEFPFDAVATMGQISVGAIIEQLPITETLEAEASITWRYSKDGAGLVMPGAGNLSELKAAVNGEFFNTLDLQATYASDGNAWASFDINGGAIAGYGASFNLPLEAIELSALEVIEI
jgi:hypothetical protein